MNKVLSEIAAERARQVSKLGWTPEHDDEEHVDGSLAKAAAIYADPSPQWYADARIDTPIGWPEGWDYKPKSRRENLIRASALMVAEIERIDRSIDLRKEPAS